jgi:hypothetical protein
MPYRISLTIKAQRDFANLPPPVKSTVFTQLKVLAEDPASLSEPSPFPDPEDVCQIFRFDFEFERSFCEVCALFQYGQDEQSLYILGIKILEH